MPAQQLPSVKPAPPRQLPLAQATLSAAPFHLHGSGARSSRIAAAATTFRAARENHRGSLCPCSLLRHGSSQPPRQPAYLLPSTTVAVAPLHPAPPWQPPPAQQCPPSRPPKPPRQLSPVQLGPPRQLPAAHATRAAAPLHQHGSGARASRTHFRGSHYTPHRPPTPLCQRRTASAAAAAAAGPAAHDQHIGSRHLADPRPAPPRHHSPSHLTSPPRYPLPAHAAAAAATRPGVTRINLAAVAVAA